MTEEGPVRTAERPPDGWDAFVEQEPEGTFCHLTAWSSVFDGVFGHDVVFAWTEDAEGVDAVMPLVRMPSMAVGHALVSVPYLNYGGPIGSDAGRSALARWALEERARAGAASLELRCRDPVPGEWPAGREKITVLLDLPSEAEVLWKALRSKVRSQVRRPMKEGMEVRFGPEVLPDFYHVFSVNMRDLGTPVLPAGFFDAIVQAFGDAADFAVVYHDDAPVAGGGGFVWKDEFEITWASSLRAYSRLAPNMLLYWSLMERMIERGARTFNFGRCTPGGGTHRFKSQWGSRDEELAWIGEPPAAPGEAEEVGGGRRLAQRLWQKLPLGAANALGPLLARRIPHF